MFALTPILVRTKFNSILWAGTFLKNEDTEDHFRLGLTVKVGIRFRIKGTQIVGSSNSS